ncbi:hypothetical protein Bca101_038205 [Brassica carinata]
MQQSWMKGYVWNEAMQQITPNLQVMHNPPQNSLNEILHHQTSIKEGTPRLHGSSAIDPTTTQPIAEAMALLLVVQQLHAFDYKDVVFLGDCIELFNNLDSSSQQGTCNMKKICEANSIIQDILHSANKSGFKFHYIPRSLSNGADVLAKNARIRNQGYVISRQNF